MRIACLSNEKELLKYCTDPRTDFKIIVFRTPSNSMAEVFFSMANILFFF